MNRRDFVGIGTVAVGAMALPGFSWAASDTPTMLHIIRIQMAPDVSPKLRAQIYTTMNRFKQIHSPSKFIVGRDITPEGEQHYDRTQISFLEGEKNFHDYFYDPIHLAADREAYDTKEKPFASIASFDTVKGGDDALPERLGKVMSDRTAKYNANDTRPTSPPVPDRPEDQRWNYGKNIFRVVRLNFSGMSEAQKAERFAALERCKEIKGVKQFFWGANAHPGSTDHFTHGMFVALESEEAYHHYLADPIHIAERDAGGRVTPPNMLFFDVIDPLDDGLAERLKKFHAEVGS
jgi:Stress responsive A/B Barrel Domain